MSLEATMIMFVSPGSVFMDGIMLTKYETVSIIVKAAEMAITCMLPWNSENAYNPYLQLLTGR